ncbi:hypothetical protein BJI47_01405 [Rhodococcus sp. 1168]|nr:hypothetical protein BJI47_01405 [Rhodococcus sp. 1168]
MMPHLLILGGGAFLPVEAAIGLPLRTPLQATPRPRRKPRGISYWRDRGHCRQLQRLCDVVVGESPAVRDFVAGEFAGAELGQVPPFSDS